MLKAPARFKSNGLILKNAQIFLLYPKLVSIIVRYIPIVSQQIHCACSAISTYGNWILFQSISTSDYTPELLLIDLCYADWHLNYIGTCKLQTYLTHSTLKFGLIAMKVA